MLRSFVYAFCLVLICLPACAKDLSARKEAVEHFMSPHDLVLLSQSQALSSALAQAISAQPPKSAPSKLSESLRLQLEMQEAVISAAEVVANAQPDVEAVLAMDRQKIVDRMAKDSKFQLFQQRVGTQYEQAPELLAYRDRNKDSEAAMRVLLGKTLDKRTVDAVMRHDAALIIFYDRTLDVVDREMAFDYLYESIGPLKPLY
jgi:hypothetical protein